MSHGYVNEPSDDDEYAVDLEKQARLQKMQTRFRSILETRLLAALSPYYGGFDNVSRTDLNPEIKKLIDEAFKIIGSETLLTQKMRVEILNEVWMKLGQQHHSVGCVMDVVHTLLIEQATDGCLVPQDPRPCPS